jgi:hypothetical protein
MEKSHLFNTQVQYKHESRSYNISRTITEEKYVCILNFQCSARLHHKSALVQRILFILVVSLVMAELTLKGTHIYDQQ